MTDKNTKYNVINIFSGRSTDEMKANVNEIIRDLCIADLEIIAGLKYNKCITLQGDASKRSVKQC